MKNSTSKSNFPSISSDFKKNTLENIPQTNFSSKAVQTMPAQLITPPARVWDKIEAILDEQDNRRKKANEIIATSFSVSAPVRRDKIYIATAAGISVVAGLLWILL